MICRTLISALFLFLLIIYVQAKKNILPPEYDVCRNSPSKNENEITLMPTCPADRNVEFKLHSSDKTVIEGEIVNNSIKKLKTKTLNKQLKVLPAYNH